jgi:hypothetical protein
MPSANAALIRPAGVTDAGALAELFGELGGVIVMHLLEPQHVAGLQQREADPRSHVLRAPGI